MGSELMPLTAEARRLQQVKVGEALDQRISRGLAGHKPEELMSDFLNLFSAGQRARGDRRQARRRSSDRELIKLLRPTRDRRRLSRPMDEWPGRANVEKLARNLLFEFRLKERGEAYPRRLTAAYEKAFHMGFNHRGDRRESGF